MDSVLMCVGEIFQPVMNLAREAPGTIQFRGLSLNIFGAPTVCILRALYFNNFS